MSFTIEESIKELPEYSDKIFLFMPIRYITNYKSKTYHSFPNAYIHLPYDLTSLNIEKFLLYCSSYDINNHNHIIIHDNIIDKIKEHNKSSNDYNNFLIENSTSTKLISNKIKCFDTEHYLYANREEYKTLLGNLLEDKLIELILNNNIKVIHLNGISKTFKNRHIAFTADNNAFSYNNLLKYLKDKNILIILELSNEYDILKLKDKGFKPLYE